MADKVEELSLAPPFVLRSSSQTALKREVKDIKGTLETDVPLVAKPMNAALSCGVSLQ